MATAMKGKEKSWGKILAHPPHENGHSISNPPFYSFLCIKHLTGCECNSVFFFVTNVKENSKKQEKKRKRKRLQSQKISSSSIMPKRIV